MSRWMQKCSVLHTLTPVWFCLLLQLGGVEGYSGAGENVIKCWGPSLCVFRGILFLSPLA